MINTSLYDQSSFVRFHEQPIADLEKFVRGVVPSAELHFYPAGEICVFTGIWAGDHQLKIWTGVFEGQNETCDARSLR